MCDPPIDNWTGDDIEYETALLRLGWINEHMAIDNAPLYVDFIQDKLEQALLKAAARCDERDEARGVARKLRRSLCLTVTEAARLLPWEAEE